MIHIKRVYDTSSSSDGKRILIDRLWPRGISKTKGKIDLWLKEIAPSNKLRIWFNHEVDKWEEFKKKYKEELKGKKSLIEQLKQEANNHPVTLVYGTKDTEHNQAIVLREALNE
ncbi:MAG: DUF488 family protein [Patescibacteria group bacterium]|nr:DUF488 family protein [Patescibacteria group bacterium]MDE2589106.1 DUF488 family protein [Patescibacteria group bacterium]